MKNVGWNSPQGVFHRPRMDGGIRPVRAYPTLRAWPNRGGPSPRATPGSEWPCSRPGRSRRNRHDVGWNRRASAVFHRPCVDGGIRPVGAYPTLRAWPNRGGPSPGATPCSRWPCPRPGRSRRKRHDVGWNRRASAVFHLPRLDGGIRPVGAYPTQRVWPNRGGPSPRATPGSAWPCSRPGRSRRNRHDVGWNRRVSAVFHRLCVKGGIRPAGYSTLRVPRVLRVPHAPEP
jgi:hypothetical protein